MMKNYSEKLYENNLLNISKIDNAIVLKLSVENNLLISSWYNSGYQENLDYIINQSLTPDDYPYIEQNGIKSFQQKRIKKLGLNPDKSTGLITSACMDNVVLSIKKYEKLTVLTIVTAGADNNGIKAGDPASFYEYDNNYTSVGGTINIITFIDANLEPGALVTALITLTEAKTSVLQDLKIESQYSNNIATGTGTDGICVISNKDSINHIENAGKHSKLGELLAQSVYEATKKALYLETAMSAEYQSTILSRLSRFNVTFYDLYKNSDYDDIIQYAILFNQINNDKTIISYISAILNLIDEVQLSLLTISDVNKAINAILNNIIIQDMSYNINSVEDAISALIDTINIYIKK